MKKKIGFLLLFVGIGASLCSNAFASVNTDLSTPQLVETTVTVTNCDAGDIWLQYNASNNYVTSHDCTGGTFSETVAGTDKLVECDMTVPLSKCDSDDSTLSFATADSGYIAQQSYVFTALEVPSYVSPTDSGEGVVTYYDWLIMNLFIIFFLSLIVFLPIIKSLFPPRERDLY